MNELALIVTEKDIGRLSTNIQEIRQEIIKMIPQYKASNYNETNLEDAKADRAMLNKLAKGLNDERIKVEREFMKPFEAFKEDVNGTIAIVKEASAAIDAVVKTVENGVREQKRTDIERIWGTKKFDVFPLEKVFREPWMNKTTSLKAISLEMDSLIAAFHKQIESLKGVADPEDWNAVYTTYITKLDYNDAVAYAGRLRMNRQAAALKAAEAPPAPPPAPEPEVPKPAPADAPQPQMYVRAFRVRGTRQQIIDLGNFMKAQGIAFEKIGDAG